MGYKSCAEYDTIKTSCETIRCYTKFRCHLVAAERQRDKISDY